MYINCIENTTLLSSQYDNSGVSLASGTQLGNRDKNNSRNAPREKVTSKVFGEIAVAQGRHSEKMSNKFDELSKDVSELRSLVATATRKRIQDMLALELRKLESELKEIQLETTEKSNLPKPNINTRMYTVNIRNYSWDQSAKFVKLYVSLKNIHNMEKEKISVVFGERSLTLNVNELDGKNHQLSIIKLAQNINSDASYHKVKTDMVVLFLAKVQQETWTAVTDVEARERKQQLEANGEDSSVMDLMKRMYTNGDDETKQMIAKAWYEQKLKGGGDALAGLNF